MTNLRRTVILGATKFQLLKAIVIADEDVPEVLQMETSESEALALMIDVIGQNRDRNLHLAGLKMKTDQIVAGLLENLNLLIEAVNHPEADHPIHITQHGSDIENDCTCY